jgi:exoribonuclease-2
MLPKSLSEQDGSLTPPDTKICQSLKLNIGANGQLTHGTFEMTKIRINQSLSYSEADDLLENRNHGLFSLFKRVTELTNASKEQRLRNGALFVDRSEMKLTCIQGERIKVEIIDINSPSREMIAELMIIYNGQVAEFCFKNNIPVAYRTQEPPDYEQSTRVVKDPLTWYITSKSLRKAALSMKPKKHFGLGVDKYTQASSPIRRYADLQLQRQLVHFLKTGLAKYSEEEMKCTTNRSEAQAKKLKLIEVSRKRYWFLKYLNDSYLKFAQAPLFQAIALEKGNGERNRFELVNYPYRSRCSLPTTVNPGDLVTVELNGVDLWHKSSQFSYSGST